MKIALVPLAGLLAGLSMPATALAQAGPGPTERPGVDLAVRAGYAFPFGAVDGDNGDSLDSFFSGAVPLILEAGYRFNSAVTAGVLFQYAFAQVKNATGCDTNGVSCSGSVIRLGIEGLYHFQLGSPFVPWAGLGTGYEWMNVDLSGPGGSGSVGAHGFEFLDLQAGGDYYVAPQFAVGPFVSLSFGRYETATSSGIPLLPSSADISNTAVHEWLQIGARGVFNL
jgi:hypothetical protein